MRQLSVLCTVLLVSLFAAIPDTSQAAPAPPSVRVRFSGSATQLSASQIRAIGQFVRRAGATAPISIETPCANQTAVSNRDILRGRAVRMALLTARVGAARLKSVTVCGPQLDPNGVFVTVHRADDGRIRVRWTPPTLNTDGTPVRNLAGYRIRAVRSGTQELNQISIDDENISDVSFNLAPGPYRISVTAFTGGRNAAESDPSQLVRGVVRRP